MTTASDRKYTDEFRTAAVKRGGSGSLIGPAPPVIWPTIDVSVCAAAGTTSSAQAKAASQATQEARKYPDDRRCIGKFGRRRPC